MAASTTTDGLFFIQTSLPTNTPTVLTSDVILNPTSDVFSTIDVHSDRPIPTAASSNDGLFSIETQTSLSSTGTASDGGLFTIETQTSLTSTTSRDPSQTIPPGTTTGTTPVVSPSNTPSEARQLGASLGLLGFVMLAWMGIFPLRH